MWILWKLWIQKYEFCKNCEFKNVDFVKIENSKMWILWKLRFQKCEFCQKFSFSICDFFGYNMDFCPCVYSKNLNKYLDLKTLFETFLTASKRLALAVLQVALTDFLVTLWIYLILMTQHQCENDRIVSAMQMPSQQ